MWSSFLSRFVTPGASHARTTEQVPFIVKFAAEPQPPSTIEAHTLYIVISGSYKKWVQFLCPCDCGQPLLLNLSTTRRPCWNVKTNWRGRPTVTPSVWREDGCKSHFFVTAGRVQWVPEVRPRTHQKKKALGRYA